MVIPILETLSVDPIANIRFNGYIKLIKVCKSIEIVVILLNVNFEFVKSVETLKLILVKMSEDKDTDVKFYAKKALFELKWF